MRKFYTSQPDGLWLVIGAAVLWGTIGVATQAIYSIDTTTPLFINLARMLIATALLLAACWRVVGHKMFQIQGRDGLIMLLSGVLLAISHAAYFAAIRYTGVSIATLLTICIAPLVVTGLSVLLKLETPTGRMIAALCCALLGSLLLVGLQAPDGTQDSLLMGSMYALMAAGSYGGVILCGRFLAAEYHPLQVTALTFCAGTLLLLLINLVSGIVVIQTAQGWLLVVYLGLVPTALAYGLFQMGLRSLSATTASIISMLEPLVAALLAWVLFGETLAVTGVIGAGLLIVSLALLSVEKKKS